MAYLDAHADDGVRGDLERTLAETVAQGYAVSRGARVPGVASVAAAIRDPAGQVIAALNVTGPQERLPRQRTAEVAAHVKSASAWVEKQLAAPSPEDFSHTDPGERT